MGFSRRFEFGLAWRTAAMVAVIALLILSLQAPEIRAGKIVAALVAFAALASLWNYIRRVGSSRVDLQACKLEYSIVSPK